MIKGFEPYFSPYEESLPFPQCFIARQGRLQTEETLRQMREIDADNAERKQHSLRCLLAQGPY